MRGACSGTLVLMCGLAASCAREAPARPDGGSGREPTRFDAGTTVGPGADDGGSGGDPSGQQIYFAQCASCHGGRAEGLASNPPLDQWTRGRAPMVQAISLRMPPTNPGSCAGACAEKVADYILGSLQRQSPAMCDGARRPPRQLRLLTRREYVATVGELFGSCRLHRFEYQPPAGANVGAVVVAGSFNNWGATAAAGGWPLTRDGARWVTERELPDGEHAYKLVVDGTTWLTDPTNPRTTPDGFGGQNSVLEVRCAGEADPWALTAAFPPETRPPGFPFDDNAAAATMTIVRLDEHWAAARALAEQRGRRLADALGCAGDRAACADRFADDFARRAYRRPLEAAERAALRAHVLAGADAVAGVTRAVRAVLASPSFLYRSEVGTGPGRLTSYEIAAALAYGLWGTTPSAALLDRAARGGLDDRAGVEATAREMLADPRARSMLALFSEQWLGIERVLTADKRTDGYPAYDAALRRELVEETGRLFTHVVLDGSHRLAELLTADYTFATPAVARLYEVPAPAGSDFARVSLVGTPRRGIFGHGSVLGAYAYSDSSSPVRRGVFVRDRLLCQHFGLPPPNAGGIPEVDPNATTRTRFEQHSSNPVCASCHKAIDPIGFGFERFDHLGRARDTEAGQPIDDRGAVADLEALGAGTSVSFASIGELGQIIAGSHAAQSCLATQYYRFARGVSDDPVDRCHVDALVARLGPDPDLRELIVGIYASEAFLERE